LKSASSTLLLGGLGENPEPDGTALHEELAMRGADSAPSAESAMTLTIRAFIGPPFAPAPSPARAARRILGTMHGVMEAQKCSLSSGFSRSRRRMIQLAIAVVVAILAAAPSCRSNAPRFGRWAYAHCRTRIGRMP
jgi:hypothetical protein